MLLMSSLWWRFQTFSNVNDGLDKWASLFFLRNSFQPSLLFSIEAMRNAIATHSDYLQISSWAEQACQGKHSCLFFQCMVVKKV